MCASNLSWKTGKSLNKKEYQQCEYLGSKWSALLVCVGTHSVGTLSCFPTQYVGTPFVHTLSSFATQTVSVGTLSFWKSFLFSN